MDSEKLIESTLVKLVNKLKGWAIKLPCVYLTGLPDRLVLLPGGIIFFAEIKTTGKKATAVQKLVHRKIRRLGFKVYVIDNLNELQTILDDYML